MKVLVCVEDRGGMMFNNRRETRDRLVSLDMLVEAGPHKLHILPYSEKLFQGNEESIVVTRFPFEDVPENGTVFIEEMDLEGYEDRIEELVVYHWNRVYPYDRQLSLDLSRYDLVKEIEFVGYSHDRITKRWYQLKNDLAEAEE